MAHPNLQMRAGVGGHPDRGGGKGLRKIFWASIWSKNKEGYPTVSPLEPPLDIKAQWDNWEKLIWRKRQKKERKEDVHLQSEARYRFHPTKIFDEFLTLFWHFTNEPRRQSGRRQSRLICGATTIRGIFLVCWSAGDMKFTVKPGQAFPSLTN